MARSKRKAPARKSRTASSRSRKQTVKKAAAKRTEADATAADGVDRSELPVDDSRTVQQPIHRRRRDGA